MKYIDRNRRNFGFPECVAFCAVTAAMRKFRRCKHFAVALVLPPDVDMDVYFRAAEALMNPDINAYGRSTNFPLIAKQLEASSKEALEALAKPRAVLIFANDDTVPEDLALAVDEVAHVRAPTTRDIRGAVRWLYDDDVGPEIARLLLSAPNERLRAVMRPGRSLKRVIAALERRPKEVAKSKKPEEPLELRLENLSGYGEAKAWGLALARDMADYQAGRIRWSDVDPGLLLSGPPEWDS